MTSNEMKCAACGAPMAANTSFCPECGARAVETEPSTRNCPTCASSIPSTAKFCPICGATVPPVRTAPTASRPEGAPTEAAETAPVSESTPTAETTFEDRLEIPAQPTVQPPVQPATPVKAKPKKAPEKLLPLVKKSVVLLVALLVCIFAFLPVFSITFEAEVPIDDDYEDIDVTVSFSAIDTIDLFFASLKDLDMDDFEDTDFYESFEDFSDEYEDIDDEDEYKELLPKAVKIYLKGNLMIDPEEFPESAIPFRALHAVCAVLGLLYILSAVAFLVFATLDLVFFLLGRKERLPGRAATVLLTLSPAFTVALSIAFRFSYFATLNRITYYFSSLNRIADGDAGLSRSAVLSIVFSLLAVALLAVLRLCFSGKIRVNVPAIVKRTLSVVAAVVLLVSVLMPAMTFEVKTTFGGDSDRERASTEIDALFFQNLEMTEDAVENWDDMKEDDAFDQMRWYFDVLSSYEKKEFKRGEASAYTDFILVTAFCGFGAAEYAWIFGLIPLLLLLAVLTACVLLWQTLYALASEKAPCAGITIPAKILGVFFAALALALIIVFTVLASYNMDMLDLEKGYSMSVTFGAGAIVTLVAAILLSAVPMGKKPEKEDTPAPYTSSDGYTSTVTNEYTL